MLNSLYIRNYRCLKDFKINRLSRINLLTGKNNTGKSSILEAIAIYASDGDMDLLYQILTEHNENYIRKEDNLSLFEKNFLSFSSLFTKRYVGFKQRDSILIGELSDSLYDNDNLSEKFVNLKFVRYIESKEKNKENILNTQILKENEENSELSDIRIGFQIKGDSTSFYRLERDFLNRMRYRLLKNNKISFQLIKAKHIDKIMNRKLYDNIALSEKEKYVIEALKIIEPQAERIAFVETDSSLDRIAVIKLSNTDYISPLLSMGDGINRILTIILAMVNAENGYLLIDEFENGLHYTSQIKLWEIIFKLAEKLNVQVFATTHSEDCIFSFERILNSIGNKEDGLLIRLDKKGDEIKYTEFDSDELRIANERNIEIR